MADSTHVRFEQGACDGASVLAALTGAYERGWHPADLVHITRRSLGAPEVRLAVWAILYEARLSRAAVRAPREWSEQLAAIAGLSRVDRADDAAPLHRSTLTTLWRHLPRLPAEWPAPSRWPTARDPQEPGWPAVIEPKTAAQIRGLLAKAERTAFAEEAETYTAKAQELISRHSVTTALVRASHRGPRSSEVQCRRFHLDNPYLKEKAQLLSEIGRCNGVRTVWFNKLAMATTVGTPLALDQVELLYTSLLAQAAQAMQEAGRHRTSPASTAFRRTFLYGFAIRIGERLRQADRVATEAVIAERQIATADAMQVLAHQQAAVDTELARLFPSVREIRSTGIDSAGWYAGRTAAERASLFGGQRRWTSEARISA